jgi:hypothetical protein
LKTSKTPLPPPQKTETPSNTAHDPQDILQVLRIRFDGVDYLFFGPAFANPDGQIQEIEVLGLTTKGSLITAMTSTPEKIKGIQ